MAWARLDDKLHSAQATLDIGLEALGLWTKAESYSSDHETDGAIANSVAELLAGSKAMAKKLAARLVAAGMWSGTSGGFQSVGFTDRNPTHEALEARRAGEAEKKRAWRSKQMPPKSRGLSPADMRGDAASCPPGSPTAPRPDPSPRPDPVPERELERARDVRGAVIALPTRPAFDERARRLLAALNAARRRVDCSSRELPELDENVKHIRARLEEGATDEDVMHVIAVRAAEASANVTAAKWLNAEMPFRPEHFQRSLAMTLRSVVAKPEAPEGPFEKRRGSSSLRDLDAFSAQLMRRGEE